jgi:ACS family tartrate transporter-like MFS transporter
MSKDLGLTPAMFGLGAGILSDFLTGAKAAAGIAAINSIGNLGGFLGPFLIGWARQATGSFTMGLMISSVTLLASAMFVISLRRSAKVSLL